MVSTDTDDVADETVQDLRDRLRDAIDAAHGADAARASAVARLRHVEYALAAAEAREAETAAMVQQLTGEFGGSPTEIAAVVRSRPFRLYWRLLAPLRKLRR